MLPVRDPPLRLLLPGAAAWEDALSELPKLLLTGRLRSAVASLPPLDAAPLLAQAQSDGGDTQLWRAHLLLSFLSHAYVWADAAGGAPPGATPPSTLPAKLATPWLAVSSALDMPPILTYATYNLLNWRRLDVTGPIELGNIVCLHNFLGGQDEEWFRLVHVAIEARAGDALAALPAAQAAAQAGDAAAVRTALHLITDTLRAMSALLGRMRERCDPHIYYTRVRWPMAGWKANAALPGGLLYEGETAPRQIYGETGAQSAIVAALDAALGIEHGEVELAAYLLEMRAHMPREHRALVARCEAMPPLRVAAAAAGPGATRDAYDEAVASLAAFRNGHRAFAAEYIAQHARREAAERGTGGSDFMPALAGYERHTKAATLGTQ